MENNQKLMLCCLEKKNQSTFIPFFRFFYFVSKSKIFFRMCPFQTVLKVLEKPYPQVLDSITSAPSNNNKGIHSRESLCALLNLAKVV